jgi:HSP20 family protein
MFWNTYSSSTDPIDELRRLHRRMNRLFEGVSARTATEFPPVNLWDGNDEYAITAEIPGMDADQLDVSVVGDTVTIKGTRTPLKLAGGEAYHRNERGYGQFARSFKLPKPVDPDKVQAHYDKGVLSVRLPLSEQGKPRRIPLKTA